MRSKKVVEPTAEEERLWQKAMDLHELIWELVDRVHESGVKGKIVTSLEIGGRRIGMKYPYKAVEVTNEDQ